jgi:U4/U6.U5 tri-snRNP-associated protein 3
VETGHKGRAVLEEDSGIASKGLAKDEDVDEDMEVEEDDDAEAAMQAMMGFGGFGTTKQKKIAGNDVGVIRREKKTEYRQYMNRVGGFNRPLSPG